MNVHRPLAAALVAVSTVVLAGAAPAAAEGRVIVYETGQGPHIQDTSDNRSLRVIHEDGTGDRDLGRGHHPAWSPGASRIAYGRNTGGGDVVTVMRADGACRSDVTPTRFAITDIEWSPDGMQLLYLETIGRPGGWIHVVDLVTGRDTTISPPAGGDSLPRWAPEGGISFQPPDQGDLWLMNADGSNRHEIVDNLGGIRSYDWLSPGSLAMNIGASRSGTLQVLTATNARLDITDLADVSAWQFRTVGITGTDRLAFGSEDNGPAQLVPGHVVPARHPDAVGTVEPGTAGYRMLAGDGGVFAFGEDCFHGSTGAMRLNQPVVGGADTPSGEGYWLVARDGGIFSFGDAEFFGSTGAVRLNQPIVDMVPTTTGKGYWLVAADGGIFTFGDARFFGSTGALRLNRPIVDMVATPSSKGYRLVAEDGGVFTFGDATFLGSLGGDPLGSPVVDADRWPRGDGYVVVTADGRVRAFGDARNVGQAFDMPNRIVGIRAAAHPDCAKGGAGYWLVASDGGLSPYGPLTFQGALAGSRLAQPIIGLLNHPAPVQPVCPAS